MADVVVEQEEYLQQIEKWRDERAKALAAPDGWLSLAGLFMLEDGDYTLGSGAENRIVLPESAPNVVGILHYQRGQATLYPSSGIDLWVDGATLAKDVTQAITPVHMVDNEHGRRPTMVKFGSITVNLHRFGDEVALRVRDSSSAAIAEFIGCKWYEIKGDHRVQGRLLRQENPTSVTVATSVQTAAQYQSVGTIAFELLGKPLQLLASVASKPHELFIIFRDATAGRTTYGAGRYLYVEFDEDGIVTLDFNKAYNPPCAFTPYATCSLPPTQNILQVAIEAGERY